MFPRTLILQQSSTASPTRSNNHHANEFPQQPSCPFRRPVFCKKKTVPGCNIAGINTLVCWNSKDLKNYHDRDRENPTSPRPNPPFLQDLRLHFQWSAYRVQSDQQVCSTNVRLHTKRGVQVSIVSSELESVRTQNGGKMHKQELLCR